MLDGLLQTKLFVPSSRAALVSRPQLIGRLTQAQAGKLTIVSAPAGYGKTTLVSEWLSASGSPFAWLSLDQNDAEPGRFLNYLVAAFETVQSDFGADFKGLLETVQPSSVEPILTRLINELAHIQESFVLVLDDYHVLDSKSIDEILSFLLDHLPPTLHLVITTREDPAFPLSRMRARGELIEIRMADLQFTQHEAAQFLNQTMALNLTEGAIGQLKERTEGWAAGLQMAAISMQGKTDVDTFIEAFTGSHRFVLDYLAEEVLASLGADLRLFLLKTSILGRLSGPLCQAVTGDVNSQAVLEKLERGNMLIFPLDGQRQWYRYHHLFADVLQAYAKLERPDELSDWHMRASAWYEDQQLWTDAAHHALASGDISQAADLLERSCPIIPKGIQPKLWLEWVGQLPEYEVERRPVLCMAHGFASLDIGDIEAAETHLANAQKWIDRSDIAPAKEMVVANETQFKMLPGTNACGRAYLAQARGDLDNVIVYAQQALEQLPSSEYYWRGNAALMLGMAYGLAGAPAAAIEPIRDSIVYQKKANNLYFQILGTAVLGDISAAQGDFRQAQTYYEQALALSKSGPLNSSRVGQVTMHLYASLSNLWRELGDLETAISYVSEGLAAAEYAIFPASEYRMHKMLARIKEAKGEFQEALTSFETAEGLRKPAAVPDSRSIPAMRARLWARQRRLSEAFGWADRLQNPDEMELTFQNEFDLMTYARVRLLEFEQTKEGAILEKVETLLEQLLKQADAAGRPGSVIELLILQAFALQLSGKSDGAVQLIERALAMAEPAGYVRVFADEGKQIRPLLAAALAKSPAPAYITRLIGAIDQQLDGDTERAADPNQMLIEPLSKRELEVLTLLSRGQSNQSIADELVIALSTVKKHVNNIFGKLNVDSRTQAVNRARELNIV